MKRFPLFLSGVIAAAVLAGCGDNIGATSTAMTVPTATSSAPTVVITQVVTVVVTLAPVSTPSPIVFSTIPNATPLPSATTVPLSTATVVPTATRVPLSTATNTSVPTVNKGPVVGNGLTCPEGYPVKANTNSSIYHVPGQQFYGATNTRNCFADAESAAAAGYRASKV